jgi:hypothetical protein
MKAKYNYNVTIRRGDYDIKVPTTHSGRETAMKVNEVMGYDYITLHIVNNLINRRGSLINGSMRVLIYRGRVWCEWVTQST